MTSSSPLTLQDLDALDVSTLKGVGDKRKQALEALDVHSILDLLETYPRRYIDRTNEARIEDIVIGVETMVLVTVTGTRSFRTRNGRQMVSVQTTDGTGRLSLTFFNQPWREKQLHAGTEVVVFGKPEMRNNFLQMTNPVVDLVGNQTGKIVPVYPQSEKARIYTWDIAGWIDEALRRCGPRGFAEPVPDDVLQRLQLIGRGDAFRAIHQPQSLADVAPARRRLAFDEVLRLQLILVKRKRALERDAKGFSHSVEGGLISRFRDMLPFPLTNAQQRVIAEICDDLVSPRPMHRLLQGDVGSGKTVVSVWTMLCAVQGGLQAALMAPTEVLAEQHATSIRAMLEGLIVPDDTNMFGDRPLTVQLLTSKVKAKERDAILANVANGTVDILIGTHALIQDTVRFKNIGVVVVDEQHRFGVEQRAALRDKALDNPDGRMPDVLTMTATPIPRTAALTAYGDLDVSVLDELPPGRTPIATQWIHGPLQVQSMWNDIRAAIARGEQAYVVCPLIEESEKLEVSSAQDTFDTLSSNELSGLRLGLLHGRMKSAEKEEVMAAFRRRNIDVLVATTVIEVGVDVPNATSMVILSAERFGIAQLHQLRGRVGRGALESSCYLVTDSDESSPRVDALVATTDGFELAEVDLQLRGEGTIMRTSQKGKTDLNLASLRTDRDLIEHARIVAFEIVDSDPNLTDHRDLYDEVEFLLTEEEIEYLFKS